MFWRKGVKYSDSKFLKWIADNVDAHRSRAPMKNVLNVGLVLWTVTTVGFAHIRTETNEMLT